MDSSGTPALRTAGAIPIQGVICFPFLLRLSNLCKYVQRLFYIVFQLGDKYSKEQKGNTDDLSINGLLIHLTRAAQGWCGAGFLSGWDARVSQMPHGSQSALSQVIFINRLCAVIIIIKK